MSGKRRSVGREELARAEQEAERRTAERDRREAARKKREPYRKAIQLAIREIDTWCPHGEGNEPNPIAEQARRLLIEAYRLAKVPIPMTGQMKPADPPPLGPNRGCTIAELEGFLQIAETEGNAERAARIRGTLNEALAAGVTDAAVKAERRHRKRIAKVSKARDSDGRRAEAREWVAKAAHAAQPGESHEVITARVIVESGHTPHAATRAVLGETSDRVKDSDLRKAVDRAVKRAVKRGRLDGQPPEELSPEDRARWDRIISERRPR